MQVLQKFSILLYINFVSYISLPSLSFSQISWLNNDRSKLHFLPKNTSKGVLSFPSNPCGDVLFDLGIKIAYQPSMKYEVN